MKTIHIIKTVLRFPFPVLLLLFSCSDFLEPRSQSEFSPETADQLNELVVSAIPDPSAAMNLTCGFFDVLSDDVETLTKYVEQRDPMSDVWYNQSYVSAIYALYTWRSDYDVYMRTNAYNVTEAYSAVYKKLIYVNAPLDYIDKVSGDAAMKDYVQAQAYTLRAFYYLHLVNMYGVPYTLNPDGPGVPVRTTSAKENRKMTRNTVREVYDLITADLTRAVALFEGLQSSQQYRQFRPTLPMALLLLSRAYLYMGDWDNAARYAQKLIDDWSHKFQIKNLDLIAADFSNVHNNAVTSTEADVRRTQKFYPGFLTYANTDVIWLYGRPDDVVQLTSKELSHGSSDRLQNNMTYATLTHASPDLINSFDVNDLRLRTYLVRDLYSEPDYSAASNTLTLGKYRAYGKLQISDSGDGIPAFSGNHFLPVNDARTYGQALRFTEAYLILAEAQAELGHDAEAKAALNEIWKNRFAGGTAPAAYTDGNDVVELVRKERRRELCFEALRWFDLRRQGMAPITHRWHGDGTQFGDAPQTFTLGKEDPGYTLPMPESMLLANPDLTQVPLRASN